MAAPPTAADGDGVTPAVNLGAQLRAARQAAGLSLRELARRLGVSPSFVSQIENGKSQPSVATLYLLSQVLEVSIDHLFAADPGTLEASVSESAGAVAEPRGPAMAAVLEQVIAVPDVDDSEPVNRTDLGSLHRVWRDDASTERLSVTTPGSRTRLVMDTGVVWEQLAGNTAHQLDFMEITYPPNSSSTSDERMLRHDGFEYGYLLEGELEITLGFDVFVLKAGEAVGLDSSVPHLLRNRGDVPARGIWFVHHRHG